MKQYIFFCIAMLTFGACKSSKNIGKTPTSAATSQSAATSIASTGKHTTITAVSVAQKVIAQHVAQDVISANAKVKLSGVGGKNLSVNGKLQMKRDNVIRISLRFLGMEVGLLEFTPQDVLVIDRINKQYVRATYSDVSFLKQAELDFYSLQSLFWNELFLPGQRSLGATDLKRFTLAQVNDEFILTPDNTPKLIYNFVTDKATSLIQRIKVQSKVISDKGEFAFEYANFHKFNGRLFPASMDMSVIGTGKDVSLSLDLSGLSNEGSFDTNTTISSKYTRRSVQDVLGKLL